MNKNSLNKRNYISDIVLCVLRIFKNSYVCYYISIYNITTTDEKQKSSTTLLNNIKKCVNAPLNAYNFHDDDELCFEYLKKYIQMSNANYCCIE